MNSKLLLISLAALIFVVQSAPLSESEEKKYKEVGSKIIAGTSSVDTHNKKDSDENDSDSDEDDKDSEEDDSENRITTQPSTSSTTAASTLSAQLIPFTNTQSQIGSVLGSLFGSQEGDNHLSAITTGVLSSLTNLTESTVEVLNTSVNDTTVGEILSVDPPEPTVTLADISGGDAPATESTTISLKEEGSKVTTVSAKDLEAEEEAEKKAEVDAVPVIFTQGV